MISIIFNIILILFCAVLQSSPVINFFTLLNWIKPDFIILSILFVTINEENPLISESLAFSTGLLIDILSSDLTGVNAFCLTLLIFVINLIKKNISILRFEQIFLFVFISSVTFEITVLLLYKIFAGTEGYFKNLITLGIPSSLYNALLGPVFFYIFKAVHKRIVRSGT